MDVQGNSEETLAIFRAIVNSSRDAIAAMTLDGTITIWNAGAERLYGYTADEAIGQPVWFLVPPDRSDEMGLCWPRSSRVRASRVSTRFAVGRTEAWWTFA